MRFRLRATDRGCPSAIATLVFWDAARIFNLLTEMGMRTGEVVPGERIVRQIDNEGFEGTDGCYEPACWRSPFLSPGLEFDEGHLLTGGGWVAG